MKARQIVVRMLKARTVSWLTNSQQAVVLPSVDGSSVAVVAVYDTGRYIRPEIVHVPDGVPEGWGMDGPIRPPFGGEDKTEESEDGSADT